MFKVQANSLGEYFDADPARKEGLRALDALICDTVPGLERWFYPGARAGAPGMRMNLIGYGCFQYEVKSGQRAQWPIVGLARQNYISLYTSVVKDGAPITDRYKASLGELKTGGGNFSFVKFDQLHQDAVVALLKDIDKTLRQDPIGALRYGTYRIVLSSVTAHYRLPSGTAFATGHVRAAPPLEHSVPAGHICAAHRDSARAVHQLPEQGRRMVHRGCRRQVRLFAPTAEQR